MRLTHLDEREAVMGPYTRSRRKTGLTILIIYIKGIAKPDNASYSSRFPLPECSMNRRVALATIASGAVTAMSGCLGHRTDDRGHLEIDRSDLPANEECAERELLGFERIHFAGAVASAIGFENAVQWTIEMRENEELWLRITGSDVPYPPLLELTDANGSVLLDSDHAARTPHSVTAAVDGTFTLWVGDRRSDGGEYFVDLVWYSAEGCSNPYTE